MLEKHSADEIGQFGYTHYCHHETTPNEHGLALVPQTIADGFEGFCTCGEWSAFASFHEFPTRPLLLSAITEAFNRHASKA